MEPPGSLLGGRYQVGACLGRGGIGEVRAGRDLRLQRDVAVKLLHAEMAAQPSVRQRFEIEARAAASVVHPRVVSVFDSGEQGGIPYLVMERLSGRTLADAIDAGPMDPDAVRELGLQVLDGLSAAHDAGLIHRDIKPANVLAAGPGQWKVGDFGIAKSVEVDADLTATGLVVGTPAYLSPERLAGGDATAASDLYAVGVILYEALVGRRALGHVTPGLPRWQPLPPVDMLRPGLPADLISVVTRAMAPRPEDRFGSASEMAAALLSAPAGGVATPGGAGGADPWAATQAVFPGPTPTEVLAAPVLLAGVAHRRRLRERRGLLAGIGAGVVVLVSILLLSVGGHGTSAAPTVTTSTSTTVASPTTITTVTTPRPATVVARPSAKGHHKHGGG